MRHAPREILSGKIGQRIQERVAHVVEFMLNDPRRFMLTLTITKVKLSPDFSRCTVYYSVLGEEKERKLAQSLLDHAKGFIRTEVGKILHTKKNPNLHFEFDSTIEKSVRLQSRIEEILREERGKETDASSNSAG